MKTGILVLNFGEPAHPTLEEVVPFLERIFFTNASLENQRTPEERRKRSRELAENRAPRLIEEYVKIGGSPMSAQSDAQAHALSEELARRGHGEVRVYSAFQFTDPLIAESVATARADGVIRLIGLPIYPLCGPSTTVAALNDVQQAAQEIGWDVEFFGVSGWHRHPRYLALRAEGIRRYAASQGVDLHDPETRLVFSAHGTPIRYLEEGSRYIQYVGDFCREMAERLGVSDFTLGYQNHSNRRIEWTKPDIDVAVRELNGSARRIVVDPVSFMHEQSETLAELDIELREVAEAAGLAFHRVPVPHDHPDFSGVLADLVEGWLDASSPGAFSPGPASSNELVPIRICRCRPSGDTFCLNG
jgi:ferrochelatase